MIITPLWDIYNGIHHARFKVGSEVYSTESEFNLTEGRKYKITELVGADIEIINDLGEKEIYTTEYFSMTKPV